ncbi:MAG: radical SAM protein [Bryobacteraceae bacterium]
MASTLQWLYKRAYDGVNYRLRTLAAGRFASHCRPTSIVFLLTELCNARCVHCDIWKNRGKEDSPTPDQWKTVLTDLRRWLGPVHVAFSGGEAMLRPYTPELVAHASQQGIFLECLTHGYWDDQSKMEKLAMARPWRLTVSLDAIGETHTKVRGREKFWEKTSTTLQTFQRVRKEKGIDSIIRLKTVVMSHNLEEVTEVARFAQREGFEVFYQAIEQNYNTPEDSRWFESSDNWPRDTERAVAVVRDLIALKRKGLPIANSFGQLESMVPYFRNPDSLRVSTQSHSAHEHKPLCAALTTLQFQATGDVTTCYGQKPVGNVKTTPIRQIWENRPRWWESGCCLERRCTVAEKETLSLPVIQ